MTPEEKSKLRSYGYMADCLRHAANLMARSLNDDPNMADTGSAVEALGWLAKDLSDSLLRMSDPEDY